MSSEDTTKITSIKKEKDPKRVEAGKRLAMISREAKERKMRERIEIEREKGWSINYGFLFGAIGVASAIGTLYYARRSDIRQVKEDEPEHAIVRCEGGHAVVREDPSLDCL